MLIQPPPISANFPPMIVSWEKLKVFLILFLEDFYLKKRGLHPSTEAGGVKRGQTGLTHQQREKYQPHGWHLQQNWVLILRSSLLDLTRPDGPAPAPDDVNCFAKTGYNYTSLLSTHNMSCSLNKPMLLVLPLTSFGVL